MNWTCSRCGAPLSGDGRHWCNTISEPTAVARPPRLEFTWSGPDAIQERIAVALERIADALERRTR